MAEKIKVRCPICDEIVNLVKKRDVWYYAKHGEKAGWVERNWQPCLLSEKIRHAKP